MGYLKIVVKIPDTIYPELVADLQRVQLRDRAERVRVLAMLGIRAIHPVKQLQSLAIGGIDQSPNEQQNATRELIRNLTESL